MKSKGKFIALLRGINVGGHHKVPMAQLQDMLENQGYSKVETLLNSGNVIFESSSTPRASRFAKDLEERFGFPVPTTIVSAETIRDLLENNPFGDKQVTKDIRRYVSFLWTDQNPELALPKKSPDGSFIILEKRGTMVFSILDVSKTMPTEAMDAIEKIIGKDMTTRNWNTVERIGKKL